MGQGLSAQAAVSVPRCRRRSDASQADHAPDGAPDRKGGIAPGEGKKIVPVHSLAAHHRHHAVAGLQGPKQIQGRLGHSTPAISMQLYTDNTVEAEDEAAAFLGKLIRRRLRELCILLCIWGRSAAPLPG